MRHNNPIVVLIGIAVLFFGLLVLGAAMKQFGRGSCLTGCCLWEMGDAITDTGCSLIGCGGALAVVAIPLLVWVGHFHR